MIVVSDTTPINYLVLIDAIGILPKLFDEVCLLPLPTLAVIERAARRGLLELGPYSRRFSARRTEFGPG